MSNTQGNTLYYLQLYFQLLTLLILNTNNVTIVYDMFEVEVELVMGDMT